MTGRRAAVAAGVLLLVVAPTLGVLTAPADAHGNHVTARNQVSGDGTVVVESLFLLEGGYLAVHENDGGEPGEVLGYVAVDQGYHRGVGVDVDESWWDSADGNESLVAVLHRDAEPGDEFDPAVDTPISSFGDVAGAEFAVRKGDGSVNVVATRYTGHSVDGSVTIPSAALADDGHLVVRSDDGGEAGEVVGHRSLPAGEHENVTVEVDDDAVPENGTSVYLWVTAYRDDGDGTFDAERDDPVTVAGSPVGSRLVATGGNGSDGGLDVGLNTPESTTTDATTGSGDADAGTGSTTDDGTTPSDDATGGDTGMPGVGVVGTIVAVAAGALLAARRR